MANSAMPIRIGLNRSFIDFLVFAMQLGHAKTDVRRQAGIHLGEDLAPKDFEVRGRWPGKASTASDKVVAQTSSLLYRRFLTCDAPTGSGALPTGSRRYSRLEVRATGLLISNGLR
jgi:hypothetical protein